MYKEDLNDLFQRALDEGEGEIIWRALNPHLPSASGEGSSLFNDPNFVQTLERFIVKNRLSIASAYSRYKLRSALAKWLVKTNLKPVRRFQIPSI